MGAKQSYLSKRDNGQKSYHCDMVAAMSEASLNSQMRMYLSHCDWGTRVYFLKTVEDDGSVSLFMLEEGTDETKIPDSFELSETVANLQAKGSSIYKELENMDLFSIESGTTTEMNENIQTALFEYCLGFAFHLEDGIPDEVMSYLIRNKDKVDINEALKIMTLDPDKKSVYYKQFFREFEVIQINTQVKKSKVIGILTVDRQDCSGADPISELWYTTCMIGIDLRGVSHKDIVDEEVKERIESLAKVSNPDTVFDISQLMLDLSTLQTVSPVTIAGLDSKAKKAVEDLVGEYFDRMEKAGQTIFGHIILTKPNLNVKYLFTPNMKNFAVSDKTLYYLINFEDGKEPLIPDMGNHVDFEWAPLLDGSVIADGTMVINATKFIPLIRSKFEPVLNNLVVTLHPYVEAGVYEYDIKWSEDENIPEQTFVVDNDKPWIASWNYQKQYHQGYQLIWAPPLPFPVASGKIESEYTASCDCQLGTAEIDGIVYPSYDFIVHIKGWMNYGYNSADNSGTYYDHTVNFQVGIKVDADGNFVLLKKVTDTDNHPSGIDISGWGRFCTFGTLDNSVKKMTDKLSNTIENVKSISVEEFTENVDTFTGWFMPGCRTYTYKQEGISDYGDFYTYINYVQE